MTVLVADTSALVRLGVVTDEAPDPLSLSPSSYEVLVPQAVVEEPQEPAAYDDDHGRAADAVLERADELTTRCSRSTTGRTRQSRSRTRSTRRYSP